MNTVSEATYQRRHNVSLIIRDYSSGQYYLLVPTLESERNFFFVPSTNIKNIDTAEIDILEYLDTCGLVLWQYRELARHVEVARYGEQDHRIITRLCILAEVKKKPGVTHLNFPSHVDIDIHQVSLDELHKKLSEGPYYDSLLVHGIANLKSAINNTDYPFFSNLK